jgi:hypothetical protein
MQLMTLTSKQNLLASRALSTKLAAATRNPAIHENKVSKLNNVLI